MPESFEGAAVFVDLCSLMALLFFLFSVGFETNVDSQSSAECVFSFAANQYCMFVHHERVCFIDDVKSHISFPYTFRVANNDSMLVLRLNVLYAAELFAACCFHFACETLGAAFISSKCIRF